MFLRALLIVAVALVARSADVATARVAPETAGRSQSGEHLLALWARDGKVDTRFPQPTGDRFPTISAIEPDGRGGWFLAGTFDSVGGVECPSLARISASGEVDKGWCPRPDGEVALLARAGDTLYITGEFSNIGTTARDGFAAISVRTGDVTAWQAQKGFRFIGGGLAADRSRVFVGGGRMAAFDGRTGRRLPWNPRFDNRGCSDARACDAEIGAIVVRRNSVYVAGNFRHVQGHRRVGLVALDARSARPLPWKANLNEDAVTSSGEIPWQLAAAGETVYVGHTGVNAFLRIGGVRRDGFAALDARTGAVRPWMPRLPRFEQGIDAFGVGGSAFVFAYDYTNSQYSDVFHTAVRLVDRVTGQKTRWTHVVQGDLFGVPFVRIAGGRVLIDYYAR
jgi:hypothetical protein